MHRIIVGWVTVGGFACSLVGPPPASDAGPPAGDVGQTAADGGRGFVDSGAGADVIPHDWDAGQPDGGLDWDAARPDSRPHPDAGPPGCAAATFFLDTRSWDQQPARVRLAGSFNDWDSERHPLTLGPDGVWQVHLSLDAGDYAYKFVVDERWIVDPHGSGYIDDGDHNVNSAYTHSCWPRADAFYVLSSAAEAGVHTVNFLLPDEADVEVLLDGEPVVDGLTRAGRSMQLVTSVLPPGVHDLVVRFGGGMRRIKLIEGSSSAWLDRAMYFVMLDRFANGDPGNDAPFDGVPEATNYRGGDLIGLRTLIEADYFNDMGLDTLWLSWPMAGPDRVMAGSRLDAEGCGLNPYDENIARQATQYSGFHGYWPTDFQEVDARFGTADDLHAVVRAAHAKGLRVVLDLPANHVHEDHPVFAQRRDDGCRADGIGRG